MALLALHELPGCCQDKKREITPFRSLTARRFFVFFPSELQSGVGVPAGKICPRQGWSVLSCFSSYYFPLLFSNLQ